jgi:hypothetical protein
MARPIDAIRRVERGEAPGPPVAQLIGFTLGLVECDVLDDEDHWVARASSTCMTLRGDQAVGR